ncbi:hypothetical protein T10_3665 [Trichinella papuae]|uniref:Uncharacterized protein n=1 Tax=Trichinella papuae TaxID=268474 RepID=A0A0V1MJW4_9BILA|nr:hypothetical protein T10_3665 [Trichinella papuae]
MLSSMDCFSSLFINLHRERKRSNSGRILNHRSYDASERSTTALLLSLEWEYRNISIKRLRLILFDMATTRKSVDRKSYVPYSN